jgi:phage terminase large subunit
VTEVSSVMEEWVARYRDDPVLYVREVYGVEPDPWQVELLEAYRRAKRPDATARDKRISVRSGHGVGKSCCVAWIADHHQTFYFPQRVAMTAPTGKQMFDVLYNEVVMWMKRKPDSVFALHEVKSDIIELRAAPEESFLTAKTASREQPEALAGVHADHVLLLVDEASGVPDAIFESASGSLSGENCVIILTGNPTRTSGLFFDTHHKLASSWTTFHVSCVDSPRVSRDFIEMMRQRYGEESNVYRVRVLGEFPRADENTILSRDIIEAATTRDIAVDHQLAPIWGVSSGWRGRAALAKRRGRVLLEPPKQWGGYEPGQVAAAVHHEWVTTAPADRPRDVIVSALGDGGIIADRLRALGLPARALNAAEMPALQSQFPDLRTELWFAAKSWFLARDCSIPAPNVNNPLGDLMLELIEELASQQHDLPSATGKIRASEPKKMYKFLGRMPDLADAFVLTFAGTATTALLGQSEGREPIRRNIKGIV